MNQKGPQKQKGRSNSNDSKGPTIRKTRAAGPTTIQERTENIRERRQQKDPRTGGNTSRRDVNKVGILEIAGTPTTADTTTTAETQRSSMEAITSPITE